MRSSLANRPKDNRGYIIPWFVTEAHEDGRPNFKAITLPRVREAIFEKRCWICGGSFSRDRTFACGPLSMISGTVSEPPGHLDCMRYAVQTCPFMINKRYERTFEGVAPGARIDRNPGVAVLVRTKNFNIRTTSKGMMFHLRKPWILECWSEGRRSTEQEILESIESGMPALDAMCQNEADVVELARMKAVAVQELLQTLP